MNSLYCNFSTPPNLNTHNKMIIKKINLDTPNKNVTSDLLIRITGLLCLLLISTAIIASASMIHRENGQILLDNGTCKLSFSDGSAFKINSISGKGNWLPDGGSFAALWHYSLSGPNGINPELDPSNGIYEGVKIKEDTPENATLVFSWKMRLSKNSYYPVRVLVSLNQTNMLSDWSIEMDLPDQWLVESINFPCITLNRSNAAKLIMPAGWGFEYTLNDYSEYSAHYPSYNGGMQLMCLHNNSEAFYYATHDKTASLKTFKAKSHGNYATISTEIIASEAWTPKGGGTFRLPWNTSIGLCAEGWQQAAVKWYRPFSFTTVWGSKPFSSRKEPQWLLNADMWLRPHFTTEETRKWLNEGLDFFGPETACHWYRWHQIEYDVDYPEYFPAKKEFVPMMKEVQQRGSHVIPYINGRLWDPASESYQTNGGAESSCRKKDGSLYIEVYGSMVPNSVTCPSSPIWQQTILDLTKRVQQELGSNGVYIDQIGAAAGDPCWAKNHNHPKGGGDFWQKSYRQMLEKVRVNLKPDNILITEDNSECYLDLFDLMLMVNSPQGNGIHVPLFPLIYSDRMMVNCFLYYPKTEKVNSLTFRMKNVLGLLWGAQLGWVKPELLMAPEARTEAGFLRDMVRFRKDQHDLIYGGQFVQEIIPKGDNPILQVENMENTPAVRGAEWIGSNGKKAILIVNMDDQKHKIVLFKEKSIEIEAKKCLRIDCE